MWSLDVLEYYSVTTKGGALVDTPAWVNHESVTLKEKKAAISNCVLLAAILRSLQIR